MPKLISAVGQAKPYVYEDKRTIIHYTANQIYIQWLSLSLLTHWCIIVIAIPPGSSGALSCVKIGNAVISVYWKTPESAREKKRERERERERKDVKRRGGKRKEHPHLKERQ